MNLWVILRLTGKIPAFELIPQTGSLIDSEVIGWPYGTPHGLTGHSLDSGIHSRAHWPTQILKDSLGYSRVVSLAKGSIHWLTVPVTNSWVYPHGLACRLKELWVDLETQDFAQKDSDIMQFPFYGYKHRTSKKYTFKVQVQASNKLKS